MLFGISLLLFSTLFQESRNTLTKKFLTGGLSKNTLAVVGNVGIFLTFLSIISYKVLTGFDFGNFFSLEYLFYQIIFIAGGMYFVWLNFKIFAIADRSTHTTLGSVGFIYSLIMDSILLGANISPIQVTGIFIIVFAFLAFNFGKKKTLKLNGAGLIFITVIIGASNNLIFKNLVSNIGAPAELVQLIFTFAILIMFAILRKKEKRKLNLENLKNYKIYLITAFGTMNIVVLTYSFYYLDASIIQTIKASFSVIYGTIFGAIFFGERNLGKKAVMLSLIILGIILITLGDIIISAI